MIAASRLALGIRPLEGESLPGLLMRYSTWVGLLSASQLAKRTGLRHPSCATTAYDLSGLALMAGLSLGEVEEIAYRPLGETGNNRFLGGSLPHEFIHLARRRCCPACLAERPYHRASWDLFLATACPKHAIRLATRCPRCSRPIGWLYGSVSHCRCGADLRTAPHVQAAPAEVAASRCILELATGDASAWLPEALRACGSADLVWLAMVMGMFLSGWRRDRRAGLLLTADVDVVARVLVMGVSAIRHWPRPLISFLEAEAAGADGRSGRYGARKVLGAFYVWLTMLEQGVAKDAIVTATRQFVASDALTARRSHRSELFRGANRDAVSLHEAAGILGSSTATVKELVSLGKLACPDGGGRGMPLVFKRADVERLAAELTGTMTLAETAAALGASEPGVRNMVKAGMLAWVDSAIGKGRTNGAFRRSDVLDMVHRIEALAPPGPPPRRRTLSFYSASEVLRREGITFPALVRLVLDGTLPVAAIDPAESGLKRLRFSSTTVRRVACADDGKPISREAVAEILDVKWEVAAHLVRVGMLRTSGGRISRKEVRRFAEEYVRCAELARQRDTSPRHMAKLLLAAGVLPVTGPGVDGGRQLFFLRKEVAAASG
jgi:hypothetical protein